jgi:hypothetical protein
VVEAVEVRHLDVGDQAIEGLDGEAARASSPSAATSTGTGVFEDAALHLAGHSGIVDQQ